jgi:hypothetical protein
MRVAGAAQAVSVSAPKHVMTNVFMRCSFGRDRFVAAGSSVSTVDGGARSWYFCRHVWFESTIAINKGAVDIELPEAHMERSRTLSPVDIAAV